MTRFNKNRNGGQQEEKQNGDKSPPVFSRRMFTGSATIEVAVFSRMIEGDKGEFETFNTVAKRTYKDGNDYKTVNSFRPEDLPTLASLLLQAHSFICGELVRE